jgi:hypothetical protein
VSNWSLIAKELNSADGADWHVHVSPTNRVIADVAYGNSNFLAVTINGPILASLDGETWQIRSAERPPYLVQPPSWLRPPWYPGWNSMTFDDGLFVASATVNDEYDGLHFTSSDGRVWTSQRAPMPLANRINDISFNNGCVVSVGNYGRIFQSDPILRLSMTRGGDSTHLRVTGPKDSEYRIETCTSFDGGNAWQTATSVSGVNPEWTDNSARTNQLYRAVLLP